MQCSHYNRRRLSYSFLGFLQNSFSVVQTGQKYMFNTTKTTTTQVLFLYIRPHAFYLMHEAICNQHILLIQSLFPFTFLLAPYAAQYISISYLFLPYWILRLCDLSLQLHQITFWRWDLPYFYTFLCLKYFIYLDFY